MQRTGRRIVPCPLGGGGERCGDLKVEETHIQQLQCFPQTKRQGQLLEE